MSYKTSDANTSPGSENPPLYQQAGQFLKQDRRIDIIMAHGKIHDYSTMNCAEKFEEKC